MRDDNRRFKVLVKWLLEGSRGGPLRARILLILHDKPSNPHQIAQQLNINYRTATHHLQILEKHKLAQRIGRGYGAPYTLTDEALQHWQTILNSINKILQGEVNNK